MAVKNTVSKKSKVSKVDEELSIESEPTPTAVKSKMPLDFDSIGLADEKSEDVLGAEEETDELDEVGLEEELDPFGDKWEA